MKIFFVASIHGKEKYEDNYRAIVNAVESLGYKIDADHVLGVNKKTISEWNEDKDIEFHKRVLEGVKKADVVLAELSYSSTSVGYLISVAVEAGKPTIVLFSGDGESHLLPTLDSNDKFQAVRYEVLDDIKQEMKQLLDYASGHQDTRFNFFISPKHQHYLDWIAKNRKLPRAVYLRRLIEEDMAKNKDYS